jgi:Ser/Thr protein kinase RdoA (MazF antagonist)
VNHVDKRALERPDDSRMESARIDAICRAFAIGRPIGQPVRIAGAMSNSNWRVRTEQGSFFIKILSWGEAGPDWRASYERRFRLEQAAIAAGVDAPRPIQAPSGGCLAEIPLFAEPPLIVRAHQWVDGTSPSAGAASAQEAAKIGVVLAKIHALELDEAADPEEVLPIYPLEDWIEREREFPELRGVVPLLKRLHALVIAGRDLVGRTLLCHRDINNRNVLRAADGRLFLLDWELAGPLDPRLDVGTAILVWSGAWQGEPNLRSAKVLIRSYREAGGEFEAGDARLFASWLDGLGGWLWLNWRKARSGRTKADRLEARRELAYGVARLPAVLDNLDGWARALRSA